MVSIWLKDQNVLINLCCAQLIGVYTKIILFYVLRIMCNILFLVKTTQFTKFNFFTNVLLIVLVSTTTTTSVLKVE